ncbi:hypothetical protein [Sphingobacterium paucimobilis]|uniref:Uncharacterized protein n=1 Tax=Sphingobacterium paucimobilis HER1398 TaxID=1346330 RepID=U2HXR7_9SPHI|nr:hypothetical protein [Sphingobacterium paucimobilis]ERJ60352.1 hypothetical protein M472_16475 [Sphingobacterium paucimobilis HER1398]
MDNIENEVDEARKEKVINLRNNEYLDKAFDLTPSNTIINKGRCGIGGTTLELNSQRHSIIVVPNIPTIESKKRANQDIIGVYGGITKNRLKKEIASCLDSGKYIKVLSTPDSFPKLVDACLDLGFDPYKECFLLLDEYHTIATELGYRENMIKPLEFLFEFENKALISATPFSLSDPRFDQFTRVKIVSEHLNKDVNVVFSKDIYGVLINFIEDARLIQNSNVHLFYNSVRSIVEVVSLLKKKDDVNIFCANTKENIGKLGDLRGLFAELGQQDFKKLNFYTAKYNEGWDLNDENAIIVLISDANLQQTCFDIEIKGTQAIGRLRNKAKEVYHITNCRNLATVNPNNIIADRKINAQNSVLALNYINENLVFTNDGAEFIENMKVEVSKYADIESTTGKAVINHSKVDSGVYVALANYKYNNKQSITDCWKKTGFNVKIIESGFQVSKEDRRVLHSTRIGRSIKNKLIIDKIRFYDSKEFHSKDDNGRLTINFSGLSEYQKLKQENPRLYELYIKLGYDKMEELNFSTPKMEKMYLLKTRNILEVSKNLRNYVHSTFHCGNKYPSLYIKCELSKIYNQFNVPKNVNASDIKKYFDAQEVTYRLEGKPVKGYFLHGRN